MPNAPFAVVMVSASFHPYVGGAEKQALELSAALRARGLDVRVLTRRLGGLPAQEEVRGVPVTRLWCAGPGPLNAATFMLSLMSRLLRWSSSYQAIHVHLAGSPALPAALVGRLLGKRVFIKLGGGRGIGELAVSSRTMTGRLKLRLLSWLKPQFVAVTKDLAEELRAYLGEVPVHVLPNGVDAARYRPVSGPEKAALRARFGWPQGLGFLYVGRLDPVKRLPEFLELWADRIKKMPAKPFLAFVGEGIESSRLKDIVGRLRLSGSVFFQPPLEEVQTAYAAADVFILPSISEGLSNALLEAMSCGLPILGSRVGGTAEAVEEAITGFLFAPKDDEELSRQLGKFLEHPELAARMGQSARQAAVERYSLEKTAEKYEALYRWGLN